MTIETNKLTTERDKIATKLLALDNIELAQRGLEELKHNHKDTESKELEIHVMWIKYEEL